MNKYKEKIIKDKVETCLYRNKNILLVEKRQKVKEIMACGEEKKKTKNMIKAQSSSDKTGI